MSQNYAIKFHAQMELFALTVFNHSESFSVVSINRGGQIHLISFYMSKHQVAIFSDWGDFHSNQFYQSSTCFFQVCLWSSFLFLITLKFSSSFRMSLTCLMCPHYLTAATLTILSIDTF